MRRIIPVLAIVLTLGATAVGARAQGAAVNRPNVQISPDGSKIAYLAPDQGALNIFVAPASDPTHAAAITHNTHKTHNTPGARRAIRSFFWAYTNNHILFLQDNAADQRRRLVVVNLADGSTKDLTPPGPVQTRVLKVSPQHPDELLITLNTRHPLLDDVHRVNINTGQLTLVQRNPGMLDASLVVGYLADDTFAIRLVQTITADNSVVLSTKTDQGWIPLLKTPPAGDSAITPLGFDLTGRILYLLDSVGRHTVALVAMDMQTGETTLLADDAHADARRVLIHPTQKTIQAVSFVSDPPRWRLFDRSIEADWLTLRPLADGDYAITSRSLDDTTWIVSYVARDLPVRSYLYDRATAAATFLVTTPPTTSQDTSKITASPQGAVQKTDQSSPRKQPS